MILPEIAGSAFAGVASWCVDANGTRSARILEAFIDVTTVDERIAAETDGAEAFDASIDLSTLGAGTALRLCARTFRLGSAYLVRISNRSGITNAFVRYDAVATVSILTASRFTRWIVDCWRSEFDKLFDFQFRNIFINKKKLTWHAEIVRISNEIRFANTFSGGWFAGGANATNNTLTTMLTPATDAHLTFRAWMNRRTLVGDANAAREWIAQQTGRTFARWSVARHNTNRILAAIVIVAFWKIK